MFCLDNSSNIISKESLRIQKLRLYIKLKKKKNGINKVDIAFHTKENVSFRYKISVCPKIILYSKKNNTIRQLNVSNISH